MTQAQFGEIMMAAFYEELTKVAGVPRAIANVAKSGAGMSGGLGRYGKLRLLAHTQGKRAAKDLSQAEKILNEAETMPWYRWGRAGKVAKADLKEDLADKRVHRGWRAATQAREVLKAA